MTRRMSYKVSGRKLQPTHASRLAYHDLPQPQASPEDLPAPDTAMTALFWHIDTLSHPTELDPTLVTVTLEAEREAWYALYVMRQGAVVMRSASLN
jgi:hypothetical protein